MLSKTERKEQVAQVHREAIITAAQDLFFSKGLEQTTIDDIAAKAQYSKRTLYKYITSKEAIYDEVALRGYRLLCAALDEIRQKYLDDPVTSLRAVLEESLRFAYAQSGYFTIILTYQIRASDFDLSNPLHQQIDLCDRQILALLQSIITQGVKQGIFRQNINPVFMAAHVITVHVGMMTILFQKKYYLQHGLALSTSEFIQQTMESIFYTLFADPRQMLIDIPPIALIGE